MKSLLPIFACFLILGANLGHAQTEKPGVGSPKTEHRTDPQGIDCANPRFSWTCSGSQKSYSIIVSLDGKTTWDSGVVKSSRNCDIEYAGKPLESSSWYEWRAEVATSEGTFTTGGRFLTGLLHEHEWTGRWIGLEEASEDSHEGMNSRLPARYMRATFAENKEIDYAVAHVGAAGICEFFINGKKIDSTQVLGPVATDYHQRANYISRDVTKLIRSGRNSVCAILGNGWHYSPYPGFTPDHNIHYGYPKLRATIIIKYKDGSTRNINTNTRWQVCDQGPVRSNNIYDGEIYDARRELGKWKSPNYTPDPAIWKNAVLTTPGGKVTMHAQKTPGMKVIEKVRPVSVDKLADGSYLVDLGRNITGTLALRVFGNEGDTIRIDFAEKLLDGIVSGKQAMKVRPNATGANILDKSNLRLSLARDLYICNGNEKGGVWTPSLVWHGFRFAVVSGLRNPATVKSFAGLFISDDAPATGHFRTDNKMFNQVMDNALTSMRGTWKGLPLDCPQRSKRLPWLGDRGVESLGETYFMDVPAQYENWLEEIRISQREDGCLPDVAPAFWLNYTDNVSWPAVYLFASRMLYTRYGTLRPSALNYESLKLWMAHLDECYTSPEGLMTKDRYGDWGVPPEKIDIKHSQDDNIKTDGVLIASAYYYKCLLEMAEMASLLGKASDAKAFRDKAASLRTAFNKAFYKNGTYSNNTVTANILPLAFNMQPESETALIVKNLRDNIMVRNGGKYSCGVVGLQWLMRTLQRYGMGDVACHLATSSEYPSFGYMIKSGATSIWEYWNGNKITDSSFNHVMLLGDLIPWCYEDLAGLRPEQTPDGLVIWCKPDFSCCFNEIDAAINTTCGQASSKWTREDGKVKWTLTIPANATAMVTLPGAKPKKMGAGTHTFDIK